MRVTQSMSDRNFISGVETLNEMLENASQQVSTGKKLLHLSDSPHGSAELVSLRDELSRIDQYRTNSDMGTFFIGVSESVLGSLHNIVTTIFTRGSSAASTDVDPQSRAGIAREIRVLRDQVLAMANTEARGRYIFAGARVTAPPFTLSGDQVIYHGDQEINRISVGDSLEVQAGVAGDAVFSPVFESINRLLTALDNNDLPAIQSALTTFSSTLSGINQVRSRLGMDLSLLQNITFDQDSQETVIRTRQSRLEDADMAKAITQLDQLQTALQATLTARSATERRNLLDYLG